MSGRETLSALREIERLAALDLVGDPPQPEQSIASSAVQQWDRIHGLLTRLGKQQLRAYQQSEYRNDQNAHVLTDLREAVSSWRDQSDQWRRENVQLREEMSEFAVKSLAIIDGLDDLALLAEQDQEVAWKGIVERLAAKVLHVYDSIGITEISAAGQAFDPEVHEVVGMTDAAEAQDGHVVASVVQRGFRFRGRVVRRAQVITTQP